jgi:zona occludens toxin
MGVDIVLVTQHPMLLDQNIRRLVNQHLHLRRITKTVAMCYEWDHCSNPGTTKTCVNSRIWMHPKAAYSLYKSAQLHTKPKARIPGIAFVGLLALAGLAYAGPVAYDRIQNTFGTSKPKIATEDTKITTDSNKTTVLKDGQLVTTETTVTQGEPLTLDTAPPEQSPSSAPAFAGCIAKPDKCVCISTDGSNFPATQDECEAKILGNSTKGQKTNDLRSVLSQYDSPSNQIHNDLDVYRFMDKR